MNNKMGNKYYEERIEFVLGSYLMGQVSYADITNTENRRKLTRLLNDAAKVSSDIKNSLSFKALERILNRN